MDDRPANDPPPSSFANVIGLEHTAQLLENVRVELEALVARRTRELTAAHQQTKMILDSITDRFFAFDSDWRMVDFNQRAADQLIAMGIDPAGLIGLVLWDVFPDPPPEEAFRRAMRERIVVTHEHYYEPLGEWVENRIYPTASGGVAIFQRYVTERKRAQHAVERSEALLANAQRLSHTGSGVWIVGTGEVSWSHEAYRIYGFDSAQIAPSPELFFRIVHPDDLAYVQQTFDRLLRDHCPCEIDFRVVRPDGSVRYIHSVCQPTLNASGEVAEVSGTVLDVTERRQAEEERARLLRRIMAAQEEERRRMSRDVHDHIGQGLAGLALNLAALGQSAEQPSLREQIEAVQAMLNQLGTDVELLIWKLRPATLDDFGLVAAISTFVTKWEQRFHVSGTLHTIGMDNDRLSGDVETVLYRVLQEALTNVAKHSSAENVYVLLQRDGDSVTLSVEDDGRGFDGLEAFTDRVTGRGLVGMRERASLLGGTVDVESHIGQGTTVTVRVPARRSRLPNGGESTPR